MVVFQLKKKTDKAQFLPRLRIEASKIEASDTDKRIKLGKKCIRFKLQMTTKRTK